MQQSSNSARESVAGAVLMGMVVLLAMLTSSAPSLEQLYEEHWQLHIHATYVWRAKLAQTEEDVFNKQIIVAVVLPSILSLRDKMAGDTHANALHAVILSRVHLLQLLYLPGSRPHPLDKHIMYAVQYTARALQLTKRAASSASIGLWTTAISSIGGNRSWLIRWRSSSTRRSAPAHHVGGNGRCTHDHVHRSYANKWQVHSPVTTGTHPASMWV